MAKYPAALAELPTNETNEVKAKDIHPALHNNVNDEVNALEKELGIEPSGIDATVGARFGRVETEKAGKVEIAELDPDPTMSAASAIRVATQLAVKEALAGKAAASAVPTILVMLNDQLITKENTTPQKLEELKLPIGSSATEWWLLEYLLEIEGANTTHDIKLEWPALPGGASMRFGPNSGVSSSVAGWGASSTANTPLVLYSSGGTTTVTMGSREGLIGIPLTAKLFGGGEAGNIIPRLSQNVSDPGQMKVLKGSMLRATKVRS